MGIMLYISIVIVVIGNAIGFQQDFPTIVRCCGFIGAGVGYALLSSACINLNDRIKDLERRNSSDNKTNILYGE